MVTEGFCKWVDATSHWQCSKCSCRVPKAVSDSPPLAACPASAREAGVSFAAHQWRLVSAVRASVSSPIPSKKASGPGTELKKMLARLGIRSSSGCKCNSRADEMDAWGPDECEKRIDEIVGWLREESAKRRLPFIEAAGRLLVKRAISNARKAKTPIDSR